jgi:hypothetical protein
VGERPQGSSSITRRDLVKRAAAVAALGVGWVGVVSVGVGAVGVGAIGVGSVLAGGEADAAAASPARRTTRATRPRVAIVGAGAGGVAAAYLLGGVADVDMFEARSKIGGHCDSQVIDYEGARADGRRRGAVLCPHDASNLRHAARAARPLRPCRSRQRRHACSARIVIHTDPAYVQSDRSNWEVYNAGISGFQCEGSVAESLAPGSQTPAALLAARGLAGISYDL